MLATRTRFALSISATAAAGALGVLMLMLWWLHREGAELEAQVAVIASSVAYQQEYTKLTDLLKETEVDRQVLESRILKEDDIVTFLAELEQAGRSLGLIIKTQELNVAPKSNDGHFASLNIVINFEGSRGDSERFLKLLDVLPYASSIDTYSHTARTRESETAGVVGSVSLLAPVQTYE